MTKNQLIKAILQAANPYSSLGLKELFPESDRIGNKYQVDTAA